MIGKPTQIMVRQGARQKAVYFNRQIMTPNGPVIENDIAMAQVKVVLEDIPATPTYRAQQLQAFSQIVQAAPPIYQAVLYPVMLELSDIPNRHEYADQCRKVGGVPGKMTPEQEQIDAQKQAQAEAIQQQIIMLEMQLKQATIAKEQAAAMKLQAEAQNIGAPQETETGGDEQQYAMVKLQAMEQELKSLQQMQKLNEQIGQLRLQLADKSAEHQLKSRELDIKEEQVRVDATAKAEDLVLKHIAANRPEPQEAKA
jgi:hypothetical protein